MSLMPENPWQLADYGGRGVWPVFTRLKTSVMQAGGLQFPWKPKTLALSKNAQLTDQSSVWNESDAFI